MTGIESVYSLLIFLGVFTSVGAGSYYAFTRRIKRKEREFYRGAE